MTPVEPGAYVALFEDEATGEFRSDDVVAIVASRSYGGRIVFEPVCSRAGHGLHVADVGNDKRKPNGFKFHGMFSPEEVREYIEDAKFQRIDAEASAEAAEFAAN
ncbi:hypothetical protein ACH4MG_34940 [Streptomyces sp. NPDC017454]|uniref:hypothetical protein n=1 Tax=Streptomyces sp. NPDC017454 TaxID=3364997 RepID=UPI00379B14EC